MDSLFTKLRKYRPRSDRDSLENFITEAFAWLLRNRPEVSTAFLTYINTQIKSSEFDLSGELQEVSWVTQENFDGKFPDMVAKGNNFILIFEHKVWASLGSDQLQNYQDYCDKHGWNYKTVFITAQQNQQAAHSDLNMLWSDVYRLVDDSASDLNDEEYAWIVKDFLILLREEGLGPPAPISHASIGNYLEAVKLRTNLSDLMKKLETYEWPLKESGYVCNSRERSGRVGLEFCNFLDSDPTTMLWKPGVFIGSVLDGSDHCVWHRMQDGLQMVLIVDFDHDVLSRYPTLSSYQNLVLELTGKTQGSAWTFYDHLNDTSVSRNKWHPLYLEKPLLEVFRGSLNYEDQEVEFIANANEALRLLCD